MTLQTEIKILDPRVGKEDLYPMPSRGTDESAGLDLHVCIDEPVTLKVGETKLIGTGIAIYLKDPNYVGLVFPRSGLGHKHGVVLGNLTGVIDADYQGELMISLWNRGDKDYTIAVGERVAQYVVVPVARPEFVVVEEFGGKSVRGAGGFGHTGK